MANSWIYDVQTDIFTIIKTKLTGKLGADYPDLLVTMTDSLLTDTSFPTVYLHFMQGVERANDLVNEEINAVTTTLQYEVTVSKEQGMRVANEVTSEVTDALKSLGFTLVFTPEFVHVNADTKRTIGRARRTIASGDSWQ